MVDWYEEKRRGAGEGENDVVAEMFVRGGSQRLRFGILQRRQREQGEIQITPRALAGI